MKLSKVLSLVLAFAMLFSAVPMIASAEDKVDPAPYLERYPTQYDPVIYLSDSFSEGATYQWYKNEEAIAEQTGAKLTADIEYCCDYVCTVVLSDSTTFDVGFSSTPNIKHQPTAESPNFSVDYPQNVTSYQWYTTINKDVAVTDENASNECKSCESSVFSSYDKEANVWSPSVIGAEISGIYELFCFEIELKADDMLLIDVGPEVENVFIVDSSLTFVGSPSFSLKGNIHVFHAPADETYKITIFTPDQNSEVSAYIRDYDEDVLLENETENILYDFDLGNYYYCIATYENDFTLKSNTMLAAPSVYKQPTAKKRQYGLSFADQAKFQWYRIDEIETAITDERAVAYENTNGKSSYDSENDVWSSVTTYEYPDKPGLKEHTFFNIELDADDVIKFKTDADVYYQTIYVYNNDESFWYECTLENGEYIFEVSASGNHTVVIDSFDTAPTLSAKLVKPQFIKLEGENTDILKNYEIGKTYFCEAVYPACMVMVSDQVTIIPEIIEQPTSENPEFVVTYEDDAKFQWYTATASFTTVDDTMVDTAYGTYDSETGEWTPHYGDPYDYYGYQEYRMNLFRIELKEGETVKVTISNPDAISPEDPDMRFGGYYSYTLDWDENGCVYFTAPEDDTYDVYQYAIYPETATFKIEKVAYTYTAIEGETDAVLSTMERGTLYAATATYDDGTVLNSNVFEAYPVITKQPTNDDPSVEMSIIEDGIKYQWYEMKTKTSTLTDEDVSYAYGTYDPETQVWTGDVYSEYDEGYYGIDLFNVEMFNDETITFVPSEELFRGYIRVYDIDSSYADDLYPNEDGSYTFKAPHSSEFSFYTYDDNELVTFKVSKDIFVRGDAVEGETESMLINPSRSAYQCVISYDEETELVSDVVVLTPAITKQPTASDPSVDVNIKEDGMKYQWYEVIHSENIVTDQDVELTDEENPATYDSETQEWTPTIYDEYVLENGKTEYELDLFIMTLDEGQTVIFKPSEELNYNQIIVMQEYGSNLSIKVKEDGSYVFVAPAAQDYYFYCHDDNAEVSFKVTYDIYTIDNAIAGETEAKLSTRKQGYYICVITYEDGIELVSDYVYLELPGDVNGDGDVNSIDYLFVKRSCFNTYTLSEDEAVRADVNGDTIINSTDYILIKRIIFGTYKV